MLNLYCYIFNVSSNSESYLTLRNRKGFYISKFKLIYQIWVLVRKYFIAV
uniref:Uncharacterized protein n=1 Tax=Heterorhabditis bacteriophora TaxID=37862 RepID=A0A1I7WLK0_HETBA